MFLNRLSNEQKELFLDLCIHASKSNNDFNDEQKQTIDQYCDEMHIDIRYEEQNELPFIYDSDEKKFFTALSDRLGLAKEQTDEVIGMLNELTDVYSRINGFVFGE